MRREEEREREGKRKKKKEKRKEREKERTVKLFSEIPPSKLISELKTCAENQSNLK